MDLRRLRSSERVPSLPAEDLRRLRGLPPSWSRPIPESAVDALLERAGGLAKALKARGDLRGAAMLERATELLRRADALCTHASRVETLVQLYRALLALRADLTAERRVEEEESTAWLQAGALGTAPLVAMHGPALRETTALRNRAFRDVEAAIARVTRAHGSKSQHRGGRP